jgi:hypothetical protein
MREGKARPASTRAGVAGSATSFRSTRDYADAPPTTLLSDEQVEPIQPGLGHADDHWVIVRRPGE